MSTAPRDEGLPIATKPSPEVRTYTDFWSWRNPDNPDNPPPTSLLTLPDRVLQHIVKQVGPVDGTVLGLAHSRLYSISKAVFPNVSLYEVNHKSPFMWEYLWGRLQGWMGEKIFCLLADGGPKFVTRKRARDLEKGADGLWTAEGFKPIDRIEPPEPLEWLESIEPPEPFEQF